MLYLFVGIFTGVLGLCSTASEWWAKVYFASLPLVPFVVGVIIGTYAGRKSYRANLPLVQADD